MRRIIDLSVPINNDGTADPPGLGPLVSYHSHAEGMKVFSAKLYPGLRASDMRDGEGPAFEDVRMSTHAGTHLDAPWHYTSIMDEALAGGPKPAATIDEIDLNWCFQPGVKLDFRRFPDGYVVQASDLAAELRRIGHELKPLEIVLINTRAGERFGKADYVDSGCGMGREATLYLLEKGIRVTGIDGWSWDPPSRAVAQRFIETGDASKVWDGHKAGRDIGFCHLEKLTNLDQLPPTGFFIACFPTKVQRASAGWTRAVAIFDPVLPA